MDVGTRIGIAGVGVAVVSIFTPSLVPQFPEAVAMGGVLLGLAMAAIGLWPWLASLSFGHLRNWGRVPLWTALLVCYERNEGTLVGGVAERGGKSSRDKLGYFWASFAVHKVPVFGEKPPSRINRQVPPEEMKNLVLSTEEGTNELRVLGNKQETAYQNVYVRRGDLWKHLRYLRTLNTYEKV